MNTEILNKTAEVLFICGYAVSCELFDTHWVIVHNSKLKQVNPFENSLEGKRQACVVIEWLWIYKKKLWLKSRIEPKRPEQSSWKHMLKRLEWCLQVLSK